MPEELNILSGGGAYQGTLNFFYVGGEALLERNEAFYACPYFGNQLLLVHGFMIATICRHFNQNVAFYNILHYIKTKCCKTESTHWP